jgi:lipopolysaccharide transport system ATP-binding protein
MYVRLAFAVAAHLDPEILIVDEVLAVGDAEFQKKCLGKMKDVSGEGRTVLFVSHNMASMKSLCQRGLLMENGGLSADSSILAVIEKYISSSAKVSQSGIIPENASSMNTGKMRYTKFFMLNDNKETIDTVNYLSDINLKFEIESQIDLDDSMIDVRINTLDGIEIVHACNKYNTLNKFQIKKGKNIIECIINNNLQPGKYSITIGMHLIDGLTLDFVENIYEFNVSNLTAGSSGDFIYNFKLGLVRFNSEWTIKN